MGRISVDTAFDYSIKGLGYVSKDAQKVAKFGKGVYDLYQKAMKLDISGSVSGVKSLLTNAHERFFI